MAEDKTGELPAPLMGDDELPDLDSFMLNTEKLMNSQLVLLTSGDEFKAAVLLWCAAWRERPACSLPNDDKVLAGVARVTPRLWKKIKAGAMRGFVLCSDDRWYHPFLVKDARRAIEAVQKKRAAANRRWRREKDDTTHKVEASSATCGDLLDRNQSEREAPESDASHMQRTCIAYASHMPVTRRSLVTAFLDSSPNIVETPSPVPRARWPGAPPRRPLGETGADPPPGATGRAAGFRWARRETAESKLLLAMIGDGMAADAALELIARASDPEHPDFRDAAKRCVDVSWRRRCGWYRPVRIRLN